MYKFLRNNHSAQDPQVFNRADEWDYLIPKPYPGLIWADVP